MLGSISYFAKITFTQSLFPAVYFVNTNMAEGRSRILLSEEEMEKLPDDSKDIFKRNNIDRYIN